MTKQTRRNLLLAGAASICLAVGAGYILQAGRIKAFPLQHAFVLTGSAAEQRQLARLISEAFETPTGQKLLKRAQNMPSFTKPGIQLAVLKQTDLAQYHPLTHTIRVHAAYAFDASKASAMKTAVLHEFLHAVDLQAPALRGYVSLNARMGSPDHLFIISKLIELSARLQDIRVSGEINATPDRADDAFFRKHYQTARKNHPADEALQIALTQMARAFWFKEPPVPLSDKMNRYVYHWNTQYNEKSLEHAFFDYTHPDDDTRFTKAVSYLIEQINISVSPQELTDPTRMNLKTTRSDIVIKAGYLAWNDQQITVTASQNKLTNLLKTASGATETLYKKGKLLSTRTFYPSGRLKSDSASHKTFFDNAVNSVKTVVLYQNHIKTGLKEFDETGRLVLETAYTSLTNGVTQEKTTLYKVNEKPQISVRYYDPSGAEVSANTYPMRALPEKDFKDTDVRASLKKRLADARRPQPHLPLSSMKRVK